MPYIANQMTAFIVIALLTFKGATCTGIISSSTLSFTLNQTCSPEVKIEVNTDFLSWIQDKFNPPELHLLGYQYCGPFTKLHERLRRGDRGINRVDMACKNHDINYDSTTDVRERHAADRQLIDDLNAIENPTLGERIARWPIIQTFRIKIFLGI